ncbi:MAG: hypothetical protein KatS3mg015_2760 [Fimbriimonadales bacterium]|nr:MAG: hypothetical protein KatS3mg015_2760 [Fimbriimonadales bacterium]
MRNVHPHLITCERYHAKLSVRACWAYQVVNREACVGCGRFLGGRDPGDAHKHRRRDARRWALRQGWTPSVACGDDACGVETWEPKL